MSLSVNGYQKVKHQVLSFHENRQVSCIEEKTKVSAEIIRQTLGNQRHDNQRFSPSTPPFVTGSKPSQFHWKYGVLRGSSIIWYKGMIFSSFE